MNATLASPQKKRLQSVLDHASGDKRFKILEVHMKKHQFRHDALIEVLHKAQELFGYLEDDLLLFVSYKLKLPASRVYGVATFYHFFQLKPQGEHTCVVCMGTACYVKGADKVIAAVQVGIVDEALPADRRPGLLEIDAHHDQDVVAHLIGQGPQPPGVLHRGGRIVDRAWPDDDEQPGVFPAEDTLDLPSGGEDMPRNRVGQRQPPEDLGGRRERSKVMNVQVARCGHRVHIHGWSFGRSVR